MNSLIVRLIASHRMINREIRRELARPIPDHIRLTGLKKQRLMVKDQLFRHVPDAGKLRGMVRTLLKRFQSQPPVAARG